MTPLSGNDNGNGQKKRGPAPSDEKLARDKVEALLNVPFPLADYAPILNTILPKPMRITQPPTNDPHRLALLAQGHPFPTIPQTVIAPIAAATTAAATATSSVAPPALASATSVDMVDTAMGGDRDDAEEGDEDEGDDLDPEIGDEGEEEKSLEESPSIDESRLIGELRRKRNQVRSEIYSRPIAQLTGVYVSPYTSLKITAESDGDGNKAFKLGRAEAVDTGLDKFLREVAIKATGIMLDEAEYVLPEVTRLIGIHPAFVLSSDKSSLSLVDEGAITSFAPCIIKGSTIRADGRCVSHLAAMLIYMFQSKGVMKRAWTSHVDAVKASRSTRALTMGDLYGKTEAERPPKAKDVKEPGVYWILADGRMSLFGMSASLGIARRTDEYDEVVFGRGKKGMAQKLSRNFPGAKLAIMWHGAKLDFVDLPIPAAAIYGAESITIAGTMSWTLNPDTVKDMHQSDSKPRCFAPSIIDKPVIGLNTNIADLEGAFLRQPAINVAGARDLARLLIKLEQNEVALPSWRRDDSDPQVVARYRRRFHSIFHAGVPMSTIYAHVKLRTRIMRRAIKDVDAVMLGFSGHYLPGRNGLKWMKRKRTQRSKVA